MRFALLGDHSDGLDVARALVDSGRHELAVYSGSGLGMEYLRRWGLAPARMGDLEEVLANPALEAVIVAGNPVTRSAQLRRALQSEHHVLCVHPVDSADAYEAAMLQADARTVLLPLLPEALHPGFRRLADLLHHRRASRREPDVSTPEPDVSVPVPEEKTAISEFPVPPTWSPPMSYSPEQRPGALFDLLDMELWGTESAIPEDQNLDRPALPGWSILRMLGGEIVEVLGLAEQEEISADLPLLLSGRFEKGGLFRAAFLPHQSEARWRWTVLKQFRRFDLVFPQGWPGPACLSWVDDGGSQGRPVPHEEHWDAWNPWPAMVELFDNALGRSAPHAIVDQAKHGPALAPSPLPLTTHHSPVPVQWQDEIRCLELDEAAKRSVERRRASTLVYQEASEEVGFKGTMTLLGCSLLWLSLAFLILSIWVDWLAWLIPPAFAAFLLLQVLLRWVVKAPPEPRPEPPARPLPEEK